MTQFSAIDGTIVGFYLLLCIIAGMMVRKYVGKVEDFLVAGREMNLYLGIASLAATEFGIVTCMYTAQNCFINGFSGATPGILIAFAMLVVGLTGFCIKPMRNANACSVPELFEKNFGSKVRWLGGVVIVLGGLLNMGVFLRTGGEFLVVVTGLNFSYLEVTMTLLLLAVAIYTILGGMISVLVTDYLQFIIMSLGLLVVTVLLLFKVGWGTMVAVVGEKYGQGGFNPFLHPGMGWEYILFNLLVGFAMVLTWQTMVQRVLSAKDSRTGGKMYTRTSFFFICRFLLPGLWGIAALATLSSDEVGSNTLLAMPKMLSTSVPIGLMGILVAAMLAADMSTNSSYMLSWGTVIYNDILGPFRKRKWSEKRGLLINRMIVALIGIFLLIYGLWYELKADLWTYLAITGTIYLSSMSVLLISCLYWKKSNDWGAFGAIIVGATMPVIYLICEQISSMEHLFVERIGPYKWGVATYVATAMAMVIGSYLKPSKGGK